MKAKNIEEYFGTMLESVNQMHKDHLKTKKYGVDKLVLDKKGDMIKILTGIAWVINSI